VLPEDIPYLKRDARFLDGDFSDTHASARSGVYVSPALACWAPWISWADSSHGYNSFNDDGTIHRVNIRPLVAAFTTRIGTIWPREQTTWIGAPVLAKPLGIVSMRGSRHRRTYIDKGGAEVVVERDVPSEEILFDNHYLVMDMARLRSALLVEGLVPMWAVRLTREATAALFMNSETRFDVPEQLKHRSRDVSWLIFSGPGGDDTVLVDDTLEQWNARGAAKPTPNGGDAE
jgi:hypothetical protein